MTLAIGRLVDASSGIQLGTAFAVTGDLALTAFHCIGDRGSGQIEVRRVVVQIDGIANIDAEVEDGVANNDVALLKLCDRLPSAVEPVGLSDRGGRG